MTALAPAFHSVDHIAGLNLNYCKCCWVQCGSEGRESLWHWLSVKCEEFREMQIVRYVCAPESHDAHMTKPPSRLRTMPFSVQQQDRTTENLLTFWELALCVALALTWWASGLEKIQGARGHNFAPIFALSPDWEKEFLAPSMACSTADAFNFVCRLERDGKLDEAPQIKKQKVATGVLRDQLFEQDFADLFLCGPLKFWDQSAVVELRTYCPT